ncbi:nuclease-related domain-containing protein [Terrabacter terrigena]|uniref:Nuclease-related domain-containing protein n=1 Tax=Terrabacter terrigena TaxID=574718 RepID=A0ABW3MYC7_9MICO
MADGGSARTRAEELWARAAAEREREEVARRRAEQLEARAGAWAAGAEGERRVARVLRDLPEGWVVLHDRLLRPGTGLTNLDHVVVGPGGVFLVDAKNWAGGVSVHDDNLWQHAGRSSAKGAELDKLAGFAGEMETVLGVPVVPVVALTGRHGATFRAQRVRGVEVVPHGRLTKWLRRQPATTDAISAELLSRKIAHTYPPASGDVPTDGGPSTTNLTVPAVLSAPPSSNGTSAKRHRATAHPRRRRPSALKALAGFGLLVALSQLGPRLPDVVAGAVPKLSFPQSRSSGTTPAAPGKDCQTLMRPVIASTTGAKVVIEQARAGDVCAWWLSKPRYSSDRADLTVTTGMSVRVSLSVTGSAESRIDTMPGEVTAWLPEGTTLAGWKPSSKASQAFSLSLRFSYPEGASRREAQAAETAAEKTVTRLAEQTAIALARRETTR